MPTSTTAHAPTPARLPFVAGLDAAVLASLPLGAAGGDAGVQALQRFHALMAAEGHPVQMTRMCFDRLYAYERIALAHAGSDPALRQLALQLFHACHYSRSPQRTLS
jgi:hypothetical protein